MTGALALLAGMLLALFSAALAGTPWQVLAAISATVVFATPLRNSAAVGCAGALLAGLSVGWITTASWLESRIPAPASETRVLVEGVIRSVPQRDRAETRFDMDVVIVEGGPPDLQLRRARLTWRDAAVTPRPGERWRLLVRLAPIAVVENFAGPDTARFAFRDGVHLSGRVLPSALNQRLRLAGTSVDTLRNRVAARIGESVADPGAAALLVALAVGLTDRLSADQWRVFNATGTTHLVAISGLHVTMFALVAFFVARLAWRQIAPARRVERETFAMLLGLAAAGGYALLSGFSVPAQRTWLMLGTFALARFVARHVAASRVWSLALVAVLCLDPLSPLSAGFWLSFVAVGVLLISATQSVAEARAGRLARWWAVIRLQCALLVALAPLTFAVFGALSLAAFAVNFVAIPLVSFVLVPLVVAGALAVLVAPSASDFFFRAATTIYDLGWPALSFAADLDFAIWRAAPAGGWFPFAMLAAAVFLLRWPVSLRATAACALLPLLFPPSHQPEPGTARVQVLDAGRGSATLVFTHSHVLLFDTGDAWNTRGTRLRQHVLPALDAAGRGGVDLVVLPSLDPDRAEAAAVLAFERGVRRIVVGGGWPASQLPAEACVDSRFTWDGLGIRVFAGGEGGRSCVLGISTAGHSMLLSDDVVLASQRAEPAADAAAEWIEPGAAALIIATGGIANSRARDARLAAWRSTGAQVLDTRRVGGVELGFGTSGVHVIAAARAARYPFVWRRSR